MTEKLLGQTGLYPDDSSHEPGPLEFRLDFGDVRGAPLGPGPAAGYPGDCAPLGFFDVGPLNRTVLTIHNEHGETSVQLEDPDLSAERILTEAMPRLLETAGYGKFRVVPIGSENEK